MRCFQANSKLAIKVEDHKFDEQVLKEFLDKKNKLITIANHRKIPYYRSWFGIANLTAFEQLM